MTEDDMQKLARDMRDNHCHSNVTVLRYINERGMLIDEGAAERVAKAVWEGVNSGTMLSTCDRIVRETLYLAPVDDPDEVAAFEVMKESGFTVRSVLDARTNSPMAFKSHKDAIRRGRELERGK